MITDPIERLIKRCRFTYGERHVATTGLCGTFALALYRHLKFYKYSPELYVYVETDYNGNYFWNDDGKALPNKEPNTYLKWRHVVVKVNNNFYDITGKIKNLQADIIDYIDDYGIAIRISESELFKELKEWRHNYSYGHFLNYSKRVKNKITRIE